MTIDEMKKQKQQLTYDIAALVRKFETESGTCIERVTLRRSTIQGILPELLGVDLDVKIAW